MFVVCLSFRSRLPLTDKYRSLATEVAPNTPEAAWSDAGRLHFELGEEKGSAGQIMVWCIKDYHIKCISSHKAPTYGPEIANSHGLLHELGHVLVRLHALWHLQGIFVKSLSKLFWEKTSFSFSFAKKERTISLSACRLLEQQVHGWEEAVAKTMVCRI